jgi:predicted 3-demethylubiquinone-9 3-methyltransferase (glyoxalase superfamily)
MATDGFTTCLWYDGQAEEAAHFYVSIFKNSSIGEIARYPEGALQPAGSVMTVEFTAKSSSASTAAPSSSSPRRPPS